MVVELSGPRPMVAPSMEEDVRFMGAINELVAVCHESDVPLPPPIEAAFPFGLGPLRCAVVVWLAGFEPDTRVALLRRFPGLA